MPSIRLHIAGIVWLFLAVAAGHSFAQVSGAAAPFSRMGFSARGTGLGNAGTAIATSGELHPYYNPALVGFTEYYDASVTYTFLSLDRTLNFVSFLGKIGPTAGIGAAWINAGIGNIDARNRDGKQTGTLSTSENLFMLSFANRFTDALSLGLTLRGYLASLVAQIRPSFTIGLDAGALYRFSLDSLTYLSLAVSVADVLSQYRWDTTPIYDQQGLTTIDPLPLALRAGIALQWEQLFGWHTIVLAADVQLLTASLEGRRTTFIVENGIARPTLETESLRRSETHLRLGAMLQPLRILKFRIGVDRLGLQGIGFFELAKPAFGFSVEYPIDRVVAALDYTFMLEPNAPFGLNFLSLGVKF
ncbi:MAG: hypothetical protein RMI34_03660 [Chloroherpetonaceae bacterium]|nr:hypothetical protein [Chloroherpetonaceae bacterium]MCS7210231.1 hypothetical protein [Chloroherpetonaceae bacterium]MDW8019157.1 hypothetical protein [Chloroherpetonaceae bacterium]MDW8466892.1 hypothetical protein [Chloroherpetonaceae bacterium]